MNAFQNEVKHLARMPNWKPIGGFLLLLLLQTGFRIFSEKKKSGLTPRETIPVKEVLAKTGDCSLPLTLIPGRGVNDLILETSTEQDLSVLGLDFQADSGKSLACGEVSCYQLWKRYRHRACGLSLTFSSDCSPERDFRDSVPRKLIRIELRDNTRAVVDEDLRIGFSTYADVAKRYGPIPREWKNRRNLHFYPRGISFVFDGDSVRSRLREIAIYPPHP